MTLPSDIEKIDGWYENVETNWKVISMIREKQKAGSLIEIGVYHGRRFIMFASLMDDEDKALAIDVWSNYDDDLTHDWSGYNADRGHFEQNLKKYIPDKRVGILQRDSRLLSTQDFDFFLPCSIFSIDGNHSHQCTINDLDLAASSINDTGIIILDDYFSRYWPGAKSGIDTWLRNPENSEYVMLYAHSSMVIICKKTFAEQFESYDLPDNDSNYLCRARVAGVWGESKNAPKQDPNYWFQTDKDDMI